MAYLNVDFFSDVLGMCTQMNVLLPERPTRKKLPVLFLLHGMSDDHTAWCRFTSIERYAREREICVVMPTTHLGWYTDMALGYPYFTFLSKELPEILGSFFPVMDLRRETMFTAGLSMGGYGAFKLAISAPETFSAAVSLSGAIDATRVVKEIPVDEDKTYWSDIFGPLDEMKGGKDDILAEAERLAATGKPKPRLYAWCGTEDFLYGNNVDSWKRLRALGYDLTTKETRGDHQWKYWDREIVPALDWLLDERGED